MLNLTWVTYFISGVVVYYLALYLLSLSRTSQLRMDADPSGALLATLSSTETVAEKVVVLLVPARNEELVIGQTLDALATLRHGRVLTLVINDNSTDATWEIISSRAAIAPESVVAIDRTGVESGGGKSGTLNYGFRYLSQMFAEEDPRLRRAASSDIIVGVLDADGLLDADCLTQVLPWFGNPRVGAVQVGVRIANAADGVLPRLQDMEFVGFSCFVQTARNRFGSVGLGGNGQFNRLSALMELGKDPWNPSALTEDLDLGLSLVKAGWETRFCFGTFVGQQGLRSLRPLLRQRTRWVQGHYQCWRHLPSLVGARRVRWATRIDLVTYLLLVATVALITYSLIASILAGVGIVHVTDTAYHFVPQGAPLHALQLFLSLAVVVAFVATYQRYARRPLKFWELPTYTVIFALYSYIWAIATIRAWGRILFRRSGWVKTPRVLGNSAVARQP